MRIDAHQHYWRIARGDYAWLTPALGVIHRDFGPEDLRPLLEANGIERTILVQAAPTEAETRFLLNLAGREPSVAGVVGWTDFDAPDAPARIASLAADPLLVGLRPMIQDIDDPDWMLSPAVDQALAAMRAQRLVLDALVKPHQLSRLVVLADRHSSLSIVLDHCGKPAVARGALHPWAEDVAALARRPNVSVKLSGLATEAASGWTTDNLKPYADHVIACFGADRVLWGSDWPVLTLAGDYAAWVETARRLTAHLSDAERAAIEGGTARSVYLDGRGRA